MKRFRCQNRTAPALLAVFALAGALTVLLAIRASAGKADLAIFLSSPISPVVTPTPSVAPTATVTATPTATATPTITPTPTATLTATPVVESPRCYLPLIQVTERTRLWLPIVLQ